MGLATRFGAARWGRMAKARKEKKVLDPGSSPGRRKGRRLKVFKTPIGFHDAYVAAPSRAAALRAWGAGTDLFSAGIAEEVTGQSAAAKAALAKAGEVVRVKRVGEGDVSTGPTPRSPPLKGRGRRKPSRGAVERAEAAVAALVAKQTAERAALAKEEDKLAKRRRALEEKQRKASERAEAKRDAVKARYKQQMAEWMD